MKTSYATASGFVSETFFAFVPKDAELQLLHIIFLQLTEFIQLKKHLHLNL